MIEGKRTPVRLPFHGRGVIGLCCVLLLFAAGCKSISHSSSGGGQSPAAGLCCESGVDLTLTRAAMLALIQRAVERPVSSTLLPAAWQGLIAQAKKVGVHIGDDAAPRFTGDPKDDFAAFNDAFDKLIAGHYGAVDVTQLNYAAIDKMAQSLGDTHTSFLPPLQATLSQRREAGNLGTSTGIRLERVTERPPIVLEVDPDSAGTDAGVVPGDTVISLNGQQVQTFTPGQVRRTLEGPDGSKLKLDIRHAGSARLQTVTLTRRTTSENLVHSAVLPGNVGYIRIREFPEQVPIQLQVRQALQDFDASQTDGVIVDLRGNPGGSTVVLQAILSEFVSQTPLAYSVAPGGGVEPMARVGPFNLHQRVVVLTDDGSASAAEIFAAAVQEYGDGLIVGAPTCGCLVEAEFVPFAGDKSQLEIGEARILTPVQQREIEKSPVLPDRPAAADPRLLSQGRDPQLEAALVSLGVSDGTARTALRAIVAGG